MWSAFLSGILSWMLTLFVTCHWNFRLLKINGDLMGIWWDIMMIWWNIMGIKEGIQCGYPLVNCYITMERSTIFNWKIDYFDWAIFQFANCKRWPEAIRSDIIGEHRLRATSKSAILAIWVCLEIGLVMVNRWLIYYNQIWICIYIYGFVWKCWVNIPNEIAI